MNQPQSINDLLRRLGTTMCCAATVACLLMAATFFIFNLKVAVDDVAANLTRQSDTFLRSFREAEILGDRESEAYLLTWLGTKHPVVKATLEAADPGACFPVRYQISGFSVCWHNLTRVLLTHPIDAPSRKVLALEIVPPIFDRTFLFPLVLIFCSTFTVMLGSFIWFFVLVKTRISDQVKGLHKTLLDAHVPDVDGYGKNQLKEFVSLQRAIRDYHQTREYRAVGQAAQMLAHDVRRPFTILRMGLALLEQAADPVSVRSILSRLVPEVDRAVTSVSSMIQNVMDIGAPPTAGNRSPASPEALIEAALGEVFRVGPMTNVAFSYTFGHRHLANVDGARVVRVLSNIVGNAVEAMAGKGSLWFKTRETGGFIEFCIGNSASFIPAADLSRLFEPFFTKGKRSGTGLGLTIAQKLIVAHGGKIWCTSTKDEVFPDGKVEFWLTLPAAHEATGKTTTQLPASTGEIVRPLCAATDAVLEEGGVVGDRDERSEANLESDVIAAASRLKRPLRLLVVDDESVYRQAFSALVYRTPALRAAVELIAATSSEEALALVGTRGFDLIVSDIDLGSGSHEGFDLVQKIRRLPACQSLICVHSNRMFFTDYRTAVDKGADVFIPKPMTRGQLLKMIVQASQNVRPSSATSTGGHALSGKPRVAVIDDDPFVLEGWQSALADDATVDAFASPKDFNARLQTDRGFLGQLTLVITDDYFADSPPNGIDLGRLIKCHRAALPVLLSSDGEFSPESMYGCIDRVISKTPMRLAELLTGARVDRLLRDATLATNRLYG